MSEVWLATDRRLGRPVAIKLLSAALADDPAFRARFRREAQVLATLRHPNIVQVYDCGEADGTAFLAMEYVPGANLNELLRERGRLDEDEALRLAGQAAAGLQAAHEHGIVHRDVKPHNLLLDQADELRVTDFGIARTLDASAADAPTSLIGTARYLSPEQARGEHADYRSDVYALGVVLFELLCGRPPFDGDSPVAIALKHRDEAAPRPRWLCPELSPETEAVVRRAMEKEASQRYQSAAQMGEAIRRARQTLASRLPADGAPLADVEMTMAMPVLRGDSTMRLPRVEPTARPAAPPAPRTWRPLVWLGAALAFGLFVVAARTWTPPWSNSLPSVTGRPAAEVVAPAVATRPAKPSAPSPALASKPLGTGPCQFVLGFKQLRDKIPAVVGDCLENEWHDDRTGDSYQRTTRGMLVWRKADGVTSFTDGRRTWIDRPDGVLAPSEG
jgi:serine/threonine-protein kinase